MRGCSGDEVLKLLGSALSVPCTYLVIKSLPQALLCRPLPPSAQQLPQCQHHMILPPVAGTHTLPITNPPTQPCPQLPVQVLGDILISLDTAARQAEERRHALEQELRVLLVHGLLHLLGHDHEEGGSGG